MANIKLSPAELQEYSRKIRANGQQSADLARQIKTNINTVTSNWEGNQKDKYLQDWATVEPTLAKTVPQLLEQLAQNLDIIANRFLEADR